MSPRRRLAGALIAVASGLVLAACGGSDATTVTPVRSASTGLAQFLAGWPVWRREPRPLDLAGPLRDGRLVLAAAGRLWTLSASGRRTLFSAAYDRPGNAEPYIAAPAPGHRGCSYGADTVYALRLYGGRGVVSIRRHGPVRRLATLTAPGLLDGITFDEAGGFGHRLLVTVTNGDHTTVQAIDCWGGVRTITAAAPRSEGGIIVANPPFGPFAGDLIVPDEKSGRIYAVSPAGHTRLVVSSGLPFGQDIGVESEVQLPRGGSAGLLGADRFNPGNRHPGDNALLRIDARVLRAAGARPGDLMVATEASARLIDVSCATRSCRAHEIAMGPTRAHLEGHLGVALR